MAAPRTVVSLSFDHNYTAHYEIALPLLNNYGFKASFQVNSCRVQGTPTGPLECPKGVTPGTEFMTWGQVGQIYAQGHEIIGHTLYHEAGGTVAERAANICADRRNLLAQGFAVRNLAYPGGSSYVDQAVVTGCGYNSARLAHGLRSPQCPTCPPAGALPPQNKYALPTRDVPSEPVMAADLQKQITDAAATGGGWVQIVLQGVCETGCNVTRATLNAFLFWLRNHAPAGTEVRTIGQVIGGTLKPPPVGGGTVLADQVRPRITRLALTRRAFRVGRVSALKRRGTVVKYRLSERPTRVVFRIERRKKTRYVKVGTITRDIVKRVNRLVFTGRIRSRALRPGRYRLRVTATDAAGNRSRARSRAFRVLPRS